MEKINVSLVKMPYTIKTTKSGAAPLNIGQAIAVLNKECVSVNKTVYVDFNDSSFYLYSKMVEQIIKDKRAEFNNILPSEMLGAIERMLIEKQFNIENGLKSIFGISNDLISGLLQVYHLSINEMIEKIKVNKCNIALVYVSPSISYSLLFMEQLKKKMPNIKIIVMDNFTFEPATPYFTSIVTCKGYHDENIDLMINNDPVHKYLRANIMSIIEVIVEGEGYDFIRSYFMSNYEKITNCDVTLYSKNVDVINESADISYKNDMTNKIAVIKSQRLELDTIPFPDYDQMKDLYDFAEIEVIKGCPYRCVFCERTRMLDAKISRHSIEYIIDEIEYLKKNGFQLFTIIDCSINVDESYSIELLKRFKNERLELGYQCNLRGRKPNEELLQLLEDTGCMEVALGIETADEELLTSMNKQQNLQIIKELTHGINVHNMKLMIFLILGFPTESIKAAGNTLQFLMDLSLETEIDVVELEFYHAGFIQMLSPVMFSEYGIDWSTPNNIDDIKKASYLFSGIGIYGVAKYNYGMERSELEDSVLKYKQHFDAEGINLATFYI